MEYRSVAFPSVIDVERMVTVHYFQFARGYVFSGERHAFWEFVYMDKGSAEIGADDRAILLNEGEAIFHKPEEFHTIWAGGSKPPDIVVLSFVCQSPAMRRFEGVRMAVGDDGKRLIAQIIVEARNAWSNKLGSDYLELTPREGGPAGAEQMVRLSLEMLLVRLLRRLEQEAGQGGGAQPAGSPMPKTGASRKEYLGMLAVEMEKYMAEHMDDAISVQSLCKRFGIGGTSLKQLFRHRHGCGAMEYLSQVRHEGAKRLIRDGRLNMTQIAERCGFASVHYFSRRFSQMEGMTPSEYSRSVKGLAERPETL